MARTPRGRGNSHAGPDAGPDVERAPQGRVPPHDLDAERSVLSSLLIDTRAINEVATELRPDDFYHPAHQILFQAMLTLHDAQRPVDLITLRDHLASEKRLEAIEGEMGLAELADFEATAANVLHHARIVRDKAKKRELIRVATEIVEEGYEDGGPADRLLDSAESKVLETSREHSRSTFRSLHDEMASTFDYIEGVMNRAGGLTGVPTGYEKLDKATGGLQPGELIVLAARPSMGKTALALNIARNAALAHGKKVAIFSLEMTTQSLILRLLASEARVDFGRFRGGMLSGSEYKKLSDAGSILTGLDVWIDDSPELSNLEIKSKCRRMYSERGLDLVIVDYLQLAHAEGKRNDRKDLEIAEISRSLKALAKELAIPVMALSQLNRGPEQRDPDKRRPIMGDLRESGAIEQDADVIGFIYRDVVYNPQTEFPDRAELIIAKQRSGPTGTVYLHFLGRFARFENYTGQEEDDFGGSGAGFVGPEDAGPGGALPPATGFDDFGSGLDPDADF